MLSDNGKCGIINHTYSGALGGGSPMSHVEFKKMAMSPVPIFAISMSTLKFTEREKYKNLAFGLSATLAIQTKQKTVKFSAWIFTLTFVAGARPLSTHRSQSGRCGSRKFCLL